LNIQQVNAIGKEIAQTVKSRWGFDSILFSAGGPAQRNGRQWALCYFRLQGVNYPPYRVPGWIVHRLLTLPDEQATQELRLAIEAQARRLLDEGGYRAHGGELEREG
jgi:hypothetical protein